MKVKAVKIEVERYEGRTHECVKAEVNGPNVWEEANALLGRWSRTAPKCGGYDKCGFKVTYEDGDTYEGRYDLVGTEWPSLERHMRAHVGCYSGREKPSHLKEADYRRFLKPYEADGHCAKLAAFMDRYEIGAEVSRDMSPHESFLLSMGVEA